MDFWFWYHGVLEFVGGVPSGSIKAACWNHGFGFGVQKSTHIKHYWARIF